MPVTSTALRSDPVSLKRAPAGARLTSATAEGCATARGQTVAGLPLVKRVPADGAAPTRRANREAGETRHARSCKR
jgi:hypothetical protein